MYKLIVISAPSGAGKTSIAHFLLNQIETLSFSVSACTRNKRKNETHGKDYYFLSLKDFKKNIKNGYFLEWEEVYEDKFYGTLKSEIKRIWNDGKHVMFDVDVEGAMNIKKQYAEKCLSIFIMPPSVDSLKLRLLNRGSDSEENINIRIEKARQELSQSKFFDQVVINDNFDVACRDTLKLVFDFINKS